MKSLRVISVLPSATEMLCAIGGRSLLVGRSHEDNYPPDVEPVPVVTGQKTSFTTCADVNTQVTEALGAGLSLYSLDEARIRELRPDVILTQDICSVCAIDLVTVERLAASMDPRPRIVSLNPLSLGDVLANLKQVGEAVGLEAEARAYVERLEARIGAARAEAAAALTRGAQVPRVAFVEWPEPLYVGGHWTPQLLRLAGAEHPLNPCPDDDAGAPKSFAVPAEALVRSAPHAIIVAPCGIGLEGTRRELRRTLCAVPWWEELPAVSAGRVALVDGDAMFNRPGPRLVDALEWLVSYLHGTPPRTAEARAFPWAPLGAAADAAGEAPSSAAASLVEIGEIEEAHASAVRAGQQSYADPATGYSVFTELASFARGYCCGSGCRHCPYAHLNAPAERQRNALTRSVLVRVTRPPARMRPLLQAGEGGELELVAFDGSGEAVEAARAVARAARARGAAHAPLLAVFVRGAAGDAAAAERCAIGERGSRVRAALEAAKELDMDVLAVAVPESARATPTTDSAEATAAATPTEPRAALGALRDAVEGCVVRGGVPITLWLAGAAQAQLRHGGGGSESEGAEADAAPKAGGTIRLVAASSLVG